MTRQTWKIFLWTSAIICLLPGCKSLFGFCNVCTIGSSSDCQEHKTIYPDGGDKPPKHVENLIQKSRIDSPYHPQIPDLPSPHPSIGDGPFMQRKFHHPLQEIIDPYSNPLELPKSAQGRQSDYLVSHPKPEKPLFDVKIPGGQQNRAAVGPPQHSGPALPQPPAAIKEPVVLALEKFLSGQADDAMSHLKAYDTDSQEFFLRMLPVIAQMAHKKLDDLDQHETAVLYNQLDSLLLALRSRSELVIDEMRFCEYIEGFGNFKPLPENYVFRTRTADRPGERVWLYVQLRNLCSEQRNSQYETRLSGSVTITDVKGKKWHYRDFKDDSNPIISQTPRRDFFRTYTFHVPPLPPGTYTLTVEVRDLTKPRETRTSSKSLPFRVDY